MEVICFALGQYRTFEDFILIFEESKNKKWATIFAALFLECIDDDILIIS